MPLNIAHAFDNTLHVDLDNDPYGLATPDLIVHVYDGQVLATRLEPGTLTIAPTAPYNLDVSFGQIQSGYLALHPARQAAGSLGNYEAAISLPDAPYTVTIFGTAHQFATRALLVWAYDSDGAEVQPGQVQVHTGTYDVTITFTQAFTGRIVVCGGYGTAAVSSHSFASPTQQATIAAATHGLGTTRLGLAVYTADTPRALVVPAAITIEPDTDVVVDFAQLWTGTIVLSGSVQTLTYGRLVTAPLAVTASPTVRVRSLLSTTTGLAVATSVIPHLLVFPIATASVAVTASPMVDVRIGLLATTGLVVADTGTPHLSMAPVATDALVVVDTVTPQLSMVPVATAPLALADSVSLAVPVLAPAVTERLTLDAVALFGTTLGVQPQAAVRLGTTTTVHLPVLPSLVSTAVSLASTSTVHVPVLRRLVSEVTPLVATPLVDLRAGLLVGTSVGVVASPLVQLPFVLLTVSESLAVAETSSPTQATTLQVTDPLVVTAQPTLSLPYLRLVVSTGCAVTTPITRLLRSFVPVTTALGIISTAAVRVPRLEIQVSERLEVATTPMVRMTWRVQVSASVAVATSPTVQRSLLLLVGDGVVVAATAASRPQWAALVADGVSATATASVQVRMTVSVTAPLPLSDQPTLRIPRLYVLVSTLTAVTEQALAGLQGDIHLSTGVRLDATVTLLLPLLSASVTDVVSLPTTVVVPGLTVPLEVTTSVAVAETPSVAGLLCQVSITETCSVSETVTVLLPVLPIAAVAPLSLMTLLSFTGSTSLYVSQTVGVATTVTVQGLLLTTQVTEALVLTETLVVPGPYLVVQVSEALNVSTTLDQISFRFGIAVTDSVAVGEMLRPSLGITVAVTTDLAVADAVTLNLPLPLSVSESMTVSDSIAVASLLLAPVVAETVGLGETVTLLLPVVHLSVEEQVRVTDQGEVWEPYTPGYMVLDDVATVLEDAELGEQGVTIFKGGLPPDVPLVPIADASIGLVELPGLPDVMAHDGQASRVEQPQVQVIVRGNPHDYRTARKTAQMCWDVLDGIANQRLNGTWYLWVKSNQAPYWLKTDELNRPHIVFTIRVAKEPSKV